MSLIFEARTDKGQKRDHNEDSFHVNVDESLFIVADGMGGQAAGETASSMAVKSIDEFIRNTHEDSEATWPIEYNAKMTRNGNRLEAAVRIAHRKIYDFSLTQDKYGGMGTTVVCALFDNSNHLTIANVGDSRLYLHRDDKLKQMTTDHSWVNEQVKLGLLTLEQAKYHPYRNVVTRALGGKDDFLIDIDEVELKSGDIILMCTDGLTTMVQDVRIGQIINEHKERLDVVVDVLIKTANVAGGDDNITVALAKYTD
jgi:serine/threonine protein phosphatase PrpC